MLIKTDSMVSMTDANQNFSKVAKMLEQDKSVIIMRNNKPKYILLDFEEFSKNSAVEEENIDSIADRILNDNIEAFKELAK